MMKSMLLVATALVALGAAPAFAETAKMAPTPMSKSATKIVHAKKIHQAKATVPAKAKAIHHAKMTGDKAPKSLNAQEKAITRDLNRKGMQGA